MKIQIIDGKVCLRCKGKTLLGDVNKYFVSKSLLTTPSNILPLHLKQTFPPILWIFTEGEADGIESRLPFKIFSTLKCHLRKTFHASTVIKKISIFNVPVLRPMTHILLTYFRSYSQCVLPYYECIILIMVYQSEIFKKSIPICYLLWTTNFHITLKLSVE